MDHRQRDTTRQREAATASRAETRSRLVTAAGELFADQGYAATTVAAVARRAGVSVQTLYLACGSKRELLRTVLGQALSGTSGGLDAEYVPRLRRQREAATGSSSPQEQLRAVTQILQDVADRAAPWWRVYRDAAATEPEIAADWAELQRLRRGTIAALLEGVPDDALREGLDRDDAVDTVWTLASPDTYELLVERAGYSPERYRRWVTLTASAALLP